MRTTSFYYIIYNEILKKVLYIVWAKFMLSYNTFATPRSPILTYSSLLKKTFIVLISLCNIFLL